MSADTQIFITKSKRWGRLKPLPPEEERETMTMSLDDILRFELGLTADEIEEIKRILSED